MVPRRPSDTAQRRSVPDRDGIGEALGVGAGTTVIDVAERLHDDSWVDALDE